MDVLPFLWLSIYIYLPVFIRKCIYSFTVLGKNPTILKLFAQKTQVANEGSPFAKDELCWHVQEPQMKVCFFYLIFQSVSLSCKGFGAPEGWSGNGKGFLPFLFLFFLHWALHTPGFRCCRMTGIVPWKKTSCRAENTLCCCFAAVQRWCRPC